MNFKEIGSNFFTNDFYTSKFVKDEIIMNRYFSNGNIIYPSLGRNGLTILLNCLDLKNKTVLLPGYTCDSVIEPFMQANFKIEYYSFNKDLSIDLKEFARITNKFKPSILLVHGFYGINTFLNASHIINELQKKGCVIIQDDTQTMFSSNKNLNADYFIGSIRKWLAIPDGSYICSSKKSLKLDEPEHTKFINLQIDAFKLKTQFSKNLDQNLKIKYKALYLNAQNIIDNDPTVYSMSQVSMGILNNTNIEVLKQKRRQNYNYLFVNLYNKFSFIKTVFETEVTQDICPIYFPIYIEKREEFQKFMSDNDIFATIIWPKPKQVGKLTDDNEFIYDKIIGIPCDQRYTLTDMSRVIKVINQYNEFLKE
jgi:dTDP-4-amino-4,6-dideoxygalactose transaminase